MASTSASSVQRSFKYDVFLSFRGEDTRKTFVDHLYLALVNKGIVTYKDDEKIEKGGRISEQLITSIEESRFYIIVFSKNYASSSWCLEELVKIMECQTMTEHTAYPVFYDVEPTEVRHQNGAVGDAFAKLVAKHEKEKEEDEDVERWRNALKEAASLAGMELKNTFNGHEAKFIQQIVEKVSQKLHFFDSSIDENLVGMETRVKEVVSSLEIDSDDVRMIGIKGMGGGGKTTLARAVFDTISIRFEGKSFVENVREVSNGSSFGLKDLQQLVLRNALNDQSIHVPSVSDGKNMMNKMVGSRKILLVLDDVDKIDQLEALAGEPTWFKLGSRIIITTRDEQVLKAHRVNFIHDVSLLSDEEAIYLFSRYAFGREIPNQGYEELSRMVVHYAAGLPLTIRVLGSFLYGRVEGEWEDTIKRLTTIPLKETLKKLELSYNGLESDQKEIFMDIACMLKGETKTKAIRILESCGFCAQIGISVLEQKSLVSISKGDDDRLLLHDHIEEMGRNIVRRLHPHEPKKHRRLWIKEEIEDILVNESGTEETKCIKLGYTTLPLAIIMKGLRKLKELRFLYVHTNHVSQIIDDVAPYIPDSLQSLCWDVYPFKSLPESFQGNKLVNLEMCYSKISELWDGGEKKVLNNLKFLDLSHSKLRTFDLTVTPQLEELTLDGCSDLVELQLSIKCPSLKFLNLSSSKVSNLNLGLTPNLEKLHLKYCRWLTKIHAPVGCLKKLVDLLLLYCSSFKRFEFKKQHESDDVKITAEYVGTCPLHRENYLPYFEFECIYDEDGSSWSGNLEKLISSASGLCACKNREYVLATICGLQHLRELTLKGSIPGDQWQFKHLKSLKILCCDAIEQLDENVSRLECFEVLRIESCSSLRGLSNSLMKCLKRLHLSHCDQIEKLTEELGCLEELYIDSCKSLREITNIGKMKCLKRLHLSYCYQIEKLTLELGCLEELYIASCSSLREITNIGRMKCLKRLHLSYCDQVERLSEPLGRLECLVELEIAHCRWLPDILNNICKMKCLEYLSLSDCEEVEKLPEELGRLECLKELKLAGCKSLRDIPNSICKMKCLITLDLNFCHQLEKLPEELGRLECLKELKLARCKSLRDIPDSICKMKCLMTLYLSCCYQLKKLPEELGSLGCLKELDIHDTSISCLPQSINQLKGLRVIGSKKQLQSYGFTSVTKLRHDYELFFPMYYVEL